MRSHLKYLPTCKNLKWYLKNFISSPENLRKYLKRFSIYKLQESNHLLSYTSDGRRLFSGKLQVDDVKKPNEIWRESIERAVVLHVVEKVHTFQILSFIFLIPHNLFLLNCE